MRFQVLMFHPLTTALVLGAASAPAQAAPITNTLQGVGLGKYGHFAQTGPASISTTGFEFIASALEQPAPIESITAAELRWTDGDGAARTMPLSQSGPQWSYFDFSPYPTLSDLTDVYPAVNDFWFDFKIDGIGDVSELVDGPDDLWPPMIPRFDNYDEIVNADPASDLALMFPAYTRPAGALLAKSRTALFDTSGYVWDDSGDETLTTTTIPAGTLIPSEDYRLILEFEVRYLEGATLTYFTDAGFDLTWKYTTEIHFTAAPAPSSGLALAALGGPLALRRRR